MSCVLQLYTVLYFNILHYESNNITPTELSGLLVHEYALAIFLVLMSVGVDISGYETGNTIHGHRATLQSHVVNRTIWQHFREDDIYNLTVQWCTRKYVKFTKVEKHAWLTFPFNVINAIFGTHQILRVLSFSLYNSALHTVCTALQCCICDAICPFWIAFCCYSQHANCMFINCYMVSTVAAFTDMQLGLGTEHHYIQEEVQV